MASIPTKASHEQVPAIPLNNVTPTSYNYQRISSVDNDGDITSLKADDLVNPVPFSCRYEDDFAHEEGN